MTTTVLTKNLVDYNLIDNNLIDNNIIDTDFIDNNFINFDFVDNKTRYTIIQDSFALFTDTQFEGSFVYRPFWKLCETPVWGCLV